MSTPSLEISRTPPLTSVSFVVPLNTALGEVSVYVRLFGR